MKKVLKLNYILRNICNSILYYCIFNIIWNYPIFFATSCFWAPLLSYIRECDFRYHSRWKNNLSQPLTYPMTVVKINRVIAIPYRNIVGIYFLYASFDMSTHVLFIHNAHRMRTRERTINLISQSAPQVLNNTRNAINQVFLVTILFHKQRITTKQKV